MWPKAGHFKISFQALFSQAWRNLARGRSLSLRIFLSCFYTVTPSFPMDCDPLGAYPILGSKKGALWTPPMRAWRLLGRDGAGRVKRGPSVSG